MAYEQSHQGLAEKLLSLFGGFRRHADKTRYDIEAELSGEPAEDIEWCIQGLDGYCS